MNACLGSALRAWLSDGLPVVRVRITRAAGSTPREVGAAMLVAPTGACGTIGGGRLEASAIEVARAMLAGGEAARRWDVPLGPEIGQCCGGFVSLIAEAVDSRIVGEIEAAETAPKPVVLLFGAGHVGRALARTLALLPYRVRWIDERPEEFDYSIGGHVEPVISGNWEQEISEAPAGAACLVLTYSHALDGLITAAALERGSFAYVGLIGSQTKRRRFERAFRDIGIPDARIRTLVCPIGDRGIRDKRPDVIAALTAAEIIQVFADNAERASPYNEEAREEMVHGHPKRTRRTA